jgi:sec-independent protein translocase protein TatC
MATEAFRGDDALGEDDEFGRMSLVDHLAELRTRIIICVVAIAVGALIGFILYEYMFDFLIGPYRDLCEENPDISITDDCRLLATDPLEGFSVRLKVSTYGGIALVLPVLLWQVWRFVSPGLYAKEKKYALPFIGSALVLFALGAGIAYWTTPRALDFLVAIGGEDNLVAAYSPSKYFQLIVFMMLSFGIGFQFPVLLVALELVNVVTPEMLSRFRRYAIVGIAVLVAVITPSGDPISMLALTLPMVVFYELAIVVGRLVRRRRARAAA